MNQKIDNKTYLNYLFQSLNLNDLKQLCREFNIKGFSKLTKEKLIEFILDSLAEEEIKKVINDKELEIISEAINLAIKKINGEDRENISEIKIINPERHEIEIMFKGFNWETTSFLAITPENIDNPERDCDCRIGANMGFCNHFWVGFIFSLKEGFFKLSEWTLTSLPEDFEDKIKSIKLIKSKSDESEKDESIKLVDESSDSFSLMGHIGKSITVYEGEITEIEQKQQDFQGNITIYYILSLKTVRFGPRIQKKSDFREEDIIETEKLKLRISDKLHDEVNLENGDKISANGKLEKDNFLGFIVKNIRKIKRI